MKICSKCKIKKPFDSFFKNKNNKKNGLSGYCKECHKNDKKKHYKNNKEQYRINVFKNGLWFVNLKLGLECSRCGFNHPAALDFHHLDPKEKDKTIKISGRVTSTIEKREKILKEIEKCVVLCSNCHRIEHSTVINEYLKTLT